MSALFSVGIEKRGVDSNFLGTGNILDKRNRAESDAYVCMGYGMTV